MATKPAFKAVWRKYKTPMVVPTITASTGTMHKAAVRYLTLGTAMALTTCGKTIQASAKPAKAQCKSCFR